MGRGFTRVLNPEGLVCFVFVGSGFAVFIFYWVGAHALVFVVLFTRVDCSIELL